LYTVGIELKQAIVIQLIENLVKCTDFYAELNL